MIENLQRKTALLTLGMFDRWIDWLLGVFESSTLKLSNYKLKIVLLGLTKKKHKNLNFSSHNILTTKINNSY